uniref:Uncharacterized protein n=1 Tax=Setaria viridis TaxID=4556 RepID=A0A4U6VMZ6_SETVI|nr:hypothetical protein SEVIR_3G144300v2 [Setaria viridis]
MPRPEPARCSSSLVRPPSCSSWPWWRRCARHLQARCLFQEWLPRPLHHKHGGVGPAKLRRGGGGAKSKKSLLGSTLWPGGVGVPSLLATTDEGFAAAGVEDDDEYLAREAGWGVLQMGGSGRRYGGWRRSRPRPSMSSSRSSTISSWTSSKLGRGAVRAYLQSEELAA